MLMERFFKSEVNPTTNQSFDPLRAEINLDTNSRIAEDSSLLPRESNTFRNNSDINQYTELTDQSGIKGRYDNHRKLLSIESLGMHDIPIYKKDDCFDVHYPVASYDENNQSLTAYNAQGQIAACFWGISF